MKTYTVYFELFGKKMKTKILASSQLDAQNKIKNQIIFHKIEEQADYDFFEELKTIFKN